MKMSLGDSLPVWARLADKAESSARASPSVSSKEKAEITNSAKIRGSGRLRSSEPRSLFRVEGARKLYPRERMQLRP